MSDDSRAIVPVGQRGVVASVTRQIAITEKLLGRILDKNGTLILPGVSAFVASKPYVSNGVEILFDGDDLILSSDNPNFEIIVNRHVFMNTLQWASVLFSDENSWFVDIYVVNNVMKFDCKSFDIPDGESHFHNEIMVDYSGAPLSMQIDAKELLSYHRDIAEYTCPIINARFLLIPAGTFMMGSPEDEPERRDDETLHQVTISKPFYMQTTPVTQGQWQKVMGRNPSEFKNCGDDCPVEQVSWNNVQDFIGMLNRQEGTDKYRLPTAAEWEYACRAGSTTAYCFGNDPGRLGEYAWYVENTRDESHPHPVGQKKPNAWGLYDMHGNVWEWVQDWQGHYLSGSVTDPEGPSTGSYRVDRGGAWYIDAGFCRSAFRLGNDPGRRFNALGFRLLRTR